MILTHQNEPSLICRAIKTGHLARPTMGWPLSEPTQPDSFICESRKCQPSPPRVGGLNGLAHLFGNKLFFFNAKKN